MAKVPVTYGKKRTVTQAAKPVMTASYQNGII
jgi:hypothetical protein